MTMTVTKASTEEEIIAQRRVKLAELRKQSCAYPNDFRRDALAAELIHAYTLKEKEFFEQNTISVRLAGRLMLRRSMGKITFAHIQDSSGRIQLYLQASALPDGSYQAFQDWDLGDIVGVTGTLFKTKTGELSVRVQQIRLLTKCLRPLPDKFHGLADQEARYRYRYLDLLMNEETRNRFAIRAKLIESIRNFLVKRGFVEVETPMMQPLPGGALARPFVTYHNALDMPLYLRVAPELYLKRLVVGGIEKVFEINRNFRNEGISTRHNPEFTMLEFYWAYADYHDLMDFTEHLMRTLAEEVLGSLQLDTQGMRIDFAQPFKRISLFDAILQENPDITASQLSEREQAKAIAERLGIVVKESYGLGKIQVEIFEKTVEHRLHQPVFITGYPAEVSPLARRNEHNPELTDRFEFFVGGREIANGFSELNDPEDQAERFRQQALERAGGDEEAMVYDQDYITALEYGMPPTAGEGIGIDRLTMLFTNTHSIRDVILFPQLRLKTE